MSRRIHGSQPATSTLDDDQSARESGNNTPKAAPRPVQQLSPISLSQFTLPVNCSPAQHPPLVASSQPTFSRQQAPAPQQQNQQSPERRQQYTLDASGSREPLPSSSPPLFTSTPPSVPSVAEVPGDIDHLVDDLSRQHFQLALRHNVTPPAAVAPAAAASEIKCGSDLLDFSSNAAEFRPRHCGNDPVTDLEVDMDDECNDNGDYPMQPPSPDASLQKGLCPSCAIGASLCNGSSIPTNPQKMQPREMAFATASVDAAPPVMGTEGADLRLLPSTAKAVAKYYPPHHAQRHSVSRSRPPQNGSHPLSCRDHASAGESEATPSSTYLPLSQESLAMPHLAPIYNHVPSSSYDLYGWLTSSSTIDPVAIVEEPVDDKSLAIAGHTDVPADTAPDATNAPSLIPSSSQVTYSQNTPASTRRQRKKQLYTAYLPQRRVASYFDAAGPVDLRHGPNPPVMNLEVDIEGIDGIDADPAITANATSVSTPAETVKYTSTYATVSATDTLDGTHQDIVTIDLRNSVRYIPLSQRIHIAHMQLIQEAMLPRARQVTGNSSTDVSAGVNAMGLDTMDPAVLSLPPGSPDAMAGAWLECSPSLRLANQMKGARKYMGPLRYRLSEEVAMRCTNLVHSKPRMRRRRPANDGNETNSACDVASVKESSTAGSIKQDKGKDVEGSRERDIDRNRDREYRNGREKRRRASGHRENSRQRCAQTHARIFSPAWTKTQIESPARVQGKAQAQLNTIDGVDDGLEAHDDDSSQKHRPEEQDLPLALQPPDSSPTDAVPIKAF